MFPETCKDCKNKVRRFCRYNSVGRGSKMCELVLKGKWNDIKQRLGVVKL